MILAPPQQPRLLRFRADEVAAQLGALFNDVEGATERDIANVARHAAALGDCSTLDAILGSPPVCTKIRPFLEGTCDAPEYSPLLIAIWEGQLPAVRRLVAAGARHGHAMHAAALRNRPEVVELLFAAGCPLHCALEVQGGPKAYFPLLCACAFGSYDAAVAIVDILERVDRTALMLVPSSEPYGGLPRMDTSPLHEVAGGPHYMSHMETRLPTYPTLAMDPVRRFIASLSVPADVPTWASMAGGRADYRRIFRLLVSAGHSLNVLDRWGFFPINIATLYGDPEHVRNCLEHGADPEMVCARRCSEEGLVSPPSPLPSQPNEKGLNALEFATCEPRMHTSDPAHPEQVIRLLVQTGVPCPLWRVDEASGGAGAAGGPGSRLVMLRWLRARRSWTSAGMDSPALSLAAALAMNDRLVQEYLFQRRKWLLSARDRLSGGSGSAGAGAAGDAASVALAASAVPARCESAAVELVAAGIPRSAATVDVVSALPVPPPMGSPPVEPEPASDPLPPHASDAAEFMDVD